MAKKITKQINSQFNPTLYSGIPLFMNGGKLIFDDGGYVATDHIQGINPNVIGADTLAAMNTKTLDPMIAKSVGGGGVNMGGIGQLASVGGDMIGGVANSLMADKPYAKQSVLGGAAKSAGKGAAAGAMFGPWGAVIGGAVGAGAGALTTAMGNKASLNGFVEQQQAQQTQQLLNSLPQQQQQYAFANGGELPIDQRVKSIDNGTLHSENGGIPIGQNALIERDEFIYKNKQGKKYIFSNKF